MENSTNFNQSVGFTFKLHVWILDTAIDGTLLVISVYLLSALVFYQLKIEQPRKKRFFSLSVEQKYKVLSKYACILIAVSSFLRLSVSFSGLWLDFYIVNYNLTVSEEAMIKPVCKALPTLRNLALTIGTGLVFLFLWFRQRIFYIHPSLKILSNKCLRIFSFGIIIGWLLFCIALYPAYFILVRFHYVKNIGCMVQKETFKSYLYLTLCWATMSIFIQISLLFLFIYPILKRSAWISHQKNEQQNPSDLINRVKKAIILALIAFATDIFSILANALLGVENTTKPTFDFGANLIVNQLVTIACFDYWRQLLWPWNLKSKSSSETSTTNISASTEKTTLKRIFKHCRFTNIKIKLRHSNQEQ